MKRKWRGKKLTCQSLLRGYTCNRATRFITVLQIIPIRKISSHWEGRRRRPGDHDCGGIVQVKVGFQLFDSSTVVYIVFPTSIGQLQSKWESILVGCVPPARQPYVVPWPPLAVSTGVEGRGEVLKWTSEYPLPRTHGILCDTVNKRDVRIILESITCFLI